LSELLQAALVCLDIMQRMLEFERQFQRSRGSGVLSSALYGFTGV
jgi:hypothetical protein